MNPLKWLTKGKREAEEWDQKFAELQEEWESRIKPLPVEQARREAEKLLSDPAKFDCYRGPISPSEAALLEPFSPLLRQFFTEYEGVESVKGGTKVWRGAIEPSDDGPPFISIGKDMDQTGLNVKPGDDTIYVGEEPFYPTIYHCLLYSDREDALISNGQVGVKLWEAKVRWEKARAR